MQAERPGQGRNGLIFPLSTYFAAFEIPNRLYIIGKDPTNRQVVQLKSAVEDIVAGVGYERGRDTSESPSHGLILVQQNSSPGLVNLPLHSPIYSSTASKPRVLKESFNADTDGIAIVDEDGISVIVSHPKGIMERRKISSWCAWSRYLDRLCYTTCSFSASRARLFSCLCVLNFQYPRVQNVRGIVRATHIQNWREISKFVFSALKAKRLDPRRPCSLGISIGFLRTWHMSDVMKARLTEMNVAGRYMRVTIVTARTVALSSTVSFVKVTRWPLDSAVISWFCRFSPSASCQGISSCVHQGFATSMVSTYKLRHVFYASL